MIRVCLVGLAAGGRSGVPRYAAALLRALDGVAGEFPDLALRVVTTRRGASAIGGGRIPLDLVGGPLANANAGVRRIMAEQFKARGAKADLLHFFDLNGPVLAPRRPFLTTIHDAAVRHGFERARMVHKAALQPWAARHATVSIAVSGFAREEAVRLFGADPTRIHVVHSGPGLIAGSHHVEGSEAGPYLLYVGNLAPHKNLPFLIEAFTEADVDARLVLVGGRGSQDEVRRAISASPRGDRIEIRRHASDSEVDRLYRGASILMLPSSYEGFGFTPLEAMARGCPVIASDIPAVREISGEGAMLLPVEDRKAWADGIRRVLSDRDLSDELRRRGGLTVRRYSWEESARSLCRIFREVGERAA